jgi:outer membrane protein TolC
MRSLFTFAVSPLLLVCSASCVATTTRSVSDADLARTPQARATVEDVERALALADLGPLAVPIPPHPTELRADQAEFWHAAAFAWNPELRQLRRQVRALRAAVGSAGEPDAIMTQGMMLDANDPEAELEFQAMFDLWGLLGLGPARAAKELARAQARSALGELEARVWSLRFEVDRARVRLAAAKALESALGALYGECSELETRITVLAQRGWLGRGMTEGAWGALHMVEHRQEMARSEATRMREELALLCGLDAAHPAFDALQGGVIDRFRADEVEWSEPTTVELINRLPGLRAAKLRLALAEAELQRMARERWPSLNVGPRLVLMDGDSIVGPMFGINVPFPGALEGAILAAREERDAALEALEDEVVAARTRAERTRLVYGSMELLALEHAPEMDRSMARMLLATQQEFLADPERLERWTYAIGERVTSLTALVNARADLVLAWFDAQEARGVAPEVQP